MHYVTLRSICVTIVAIESIKKYYVFNMPKGMHLIILSSVACPALLHFCSLSHNWQDSWVGGGVTELEMCVLISSTTFV